MELKNATAEQLAEIADRFRLNLSREELEIYKKFTDGMMESYRIVDQMVPPSPPVKYPRSGGRRPTPEENPFGGWQWKTSIQGQQDGILKGKKIAVKDNISVAGIPMVNGTSMLEDFRPSVDATLVTRILDAGGEIAGKSVCEHLCSSGASHTSDSGPVLNPHDPTRSAGGSSSGSAALLAAGEVDMAIGCDQGGSIRVPSAWCGVYGLKPTYGLVPYTGIYSGDHTLDHAGPMARTAEDTALLLEAIAGPDEWDPRQNGIKPEKYSHTVKSGIKGLRIGIVEEGFGWPNEAEHDVDEIVRSAAHSFVKAGASVESISIPLHRNAVDIWSIIITEGPLAMLLKGYGQGNNVKGYYQTDVMDAFAEAFHTRPHEFSETVKFAILLGQYMMDNYHGRYYGIARNLSHKLKAAYDEALAKYDILVMPTVPRKADLLPPLDAGTEEIITAAYVSTKNTAPFNLTGQPALNVPCGFSEGLPVGMMMIGQTGNDGLLLRAAYAFEQIK